MMWGCVNFQDVFNDLYSLQYLEQVGPYQVENVSTYPCLSASINIRLYGVFS